MKKKIGVYIGNIHSDHPSRVLEGIYDEYSKKEGVSVHIWIGAESSMFFDNKIREKSNYDYQYLSMINYEDIDDADINLVSYGSLL